MAGFNIHFNVKIKWWVKPFVNTLRFYVWLTGHMINVDKLAAFIANKGVSMKTGFGEG